MCNVGVEGDSVRLNTHVEEGPGHEHKERFAGVVTNTIVSPSAVVVHPIYTPATFFAMVHSGQERGLVSSTFIANVFAPIKFLIWGRGNESYSFFNFFPIGRDEAGLLKHSCEMSPEAHEHSESDCT